MAVTNNGVTSATVAHVDPWRCRMWEMHDRAAELLTADACRDVIRSFKEHGQALPALGRQAKNIPGIDVELIYGARRLYAAQHLNVKLAVEIVEIDDDEAIQRMYIENAHRADLRTSGGWRSSGGCAKDASLRKTTFRRAWECLLQQSAAC